MHHHPQEEFKEQLPGQIDQAKTIPPNTYLAWVDKKNMKLKKLSTSLGY